MVVAEQILMPEHAIERQTGVTVSLDTVGFDHRPTRQEAAEIHKRIATEKSTLTVEEFATLVSDPIDGRSFCPAIFSSEVRERENWHGQQSHVRDFDATLPFSDAKDRCAKYDLGLAFAYETHSSLNADRFRLVFVLPEPISDIRLWQIIQRALASIFPEADSSCHEPARMFYPGKRLMFSNFDATLDVKTLIDAVILFWMENDSNHWGRKVEQYCALAGINLENGLPQYTGLERVIHFRPSAA